MRPWIKSFLGLATAACVLFFSSSIFLENLESLDDGATQSFDTTADDVILWNGSHGNQSKVLDENRNVFAVEGKLDKLRTVSPSPSARLTKRGTLKVRIFVATYKETKLLIDLVSSIENSDGRHEAFLEIHILNNNPEPLRNRIKLAEHTTVPLFVHDNGFATKKGQLHGHLARTWNQALMFGFEDLSSPAADVVVCIQGDSKLQPNWFGVLQKNLERCSFLQYGAGDEITIYTADAVKQIGMWDERFVGITDQEADYFFRAAIHMPNRSCIHDSYHKRVYNQQPGMVQGTKARTNGAWRCLKKETPDCIERNRAQGTSTVTKEMFLRKWGHLLQDQLRWKTKSLVEARGKPPRIPSYPSYICFEAAIENKQMIGYAPGSNLDPSEAMCKFKSNTATS